MLTFLECYRPIVFISVIGLFVSLSYIRGTSKNQIKPNEFVQKKKLATFVIYTRITKTGSSLLISLLLGLQKNGFNININNNWQPDYIISLQYYIGTELAKTRKKFLFIEPTYFVNLGLPKVAYFSQIRDPIKRINSAYCFQRDMTKPNQRKQYQNQKDRLPPDWLTTTLGECIKQGKIEDCVPSMVSTKTTIQMFCGTNPLCRNPNTDAATNLALANIDEYYSVVGVLEEMDKSLEVLEDVLPNHFYGIAKEYKKRIMNKNQVKNKCEAELSPLEDPYDPVYQLLKNYLKNEYRIYNHVVQKLDQQYKNITNGKKSRNLGRPKH